MGERELDLGQRGAFTPGSGHHPTPWSQDHGRAERLSVLQWLPPCRSGPGCSEWRQLPLDTQVSRLVSACMDRAQSRSARRQGCPTCSHSVCASSADALWGTGRSRSVEPAKPSCHAVARFIPLCYWMGPVALQVLWLLQIGVPWGIRRGQGLDPGASCAQP